MSVYRISFIPSADLRHRTFNGHSFGLDFAETSVWEGCVKDSIVSEVFEDRQAVTRNIVAGSAIAASIMVETDAMRHVLAAAIPGAGTAAEVTDFFFMGAHVVSAFGFCCYVVVSDPLLFGYVSHLVPFPAGDIGRLGADACARMLAGAALCGSVGPEEEADFLDWIGLHCDADHADWDLIYAILFYVRGSRRLTDFADCIPSSPDGLMINEEQLLELCTMPRVDDLVPLLGDSTAYMLYDRVAKELGFENPTVVQEFIDWIDSAVAAHEADSGSDYTEDTLSVYSDPGSPADEIAELDPDDEAMYVAEAVFGVHALAIAAELLDEEEDADEDVALHAAPAA